MADKDDENLIGYDPLAWMSDQTEDLPANPAADDNADDLMGAMADRLPTDAAANDWLAEDDTNTHSGQATPNDSGVTHLTLESTQGIQNVAELHEKLLRALDQGEKIEIDASAVQQIDTSSLQLLLVLKRSAISLSKEVSIDFPSERFIEAATLLGLAEMLEVDQAAAGFF